MKISTLIILSFLLLNNILSQSLSLSQIDYDLHKSYKNIQYYRLGKSDIDWDSVEISNTIFRNKLFSYLSNNPNTLTYDFDSLGLDIDIVESEDKLFRIYSWNTWLGGTMYDFGNLFQYKIYNKVFTKLVCDTSRSDGDDYIPYYSDIFSIFSGDKTYYLVVSNGIYSTKDASESIRIMTLEDNAINDTVKLFKTSKGLLNSIDVSFDFFSVVDRPERPLRLIKYDKEDKLIYIPIVYENGKVTDRYIIYKFTGQYFEYIKTQK